MKIDVDYDHLEKYWLQETEGCQCFLDEERNPEKCECHNFEKWLDKYLERKAEEYAYEEAL